MPRLNRRTLWLLALLVPLGCKDPETAANQARLQVAQARFAEGQRLMAAGEPEAAATAFREAAANLPGDPTPVLSLADAERAAGNETAAILALKQAGDLSKNADPIIKKQLAELYRQSGHTAEAMQLLTALRDEGSLSDAEILTLARLQAHSGAVEGAYQSLERIQRARPDDVDAKVVEAEVLLAANEELLAAKLMDRLLTENPGLVSARLLRARYFLNAGRADLADADMSQLPPESTALPEVVELRARVLSALKRYPEAEAAIKALVAQRPKDPELLAQLAEVKLSLGSFDEARALVEQALALRPRFARALYVRGRALEAKGDLAGATESYESALKSDSAFAPALSHIWPLYAHRGARADAMSALERLFFLNEATLADKVALAEMYLENHTDVERGRALMDEALRAEPDNAHYKEVKAALMKLPVTPSSSGAKHTGLVIMRGRH